ncbi:hypothetical protein ACFQ2B_02400 [Streptomyces stramineus]
MRSALPARLLRVKAVGAVVAAAFLLWGAPSAHAEERPRARRRRPTASA